MNRHGGHVINTRGFHILTVCTGNVVRSPMAEYAFATACVNCPDVSISSAGVQARTGMPADDRAREFALSQAILGIDAHRSREITPQLVDQAHMVLVMTREHRRDVLRMAPDAYDRTFTLNEFARLAMRAEELIRLGEITPSARRGRHALMDDSTTRDEHPLDRFVQIIARLRLEEPLPARAEDDDIADPYRKSNAEYATSMSAITRAVAQIVRLFPEFQM
ncbi:MAG: hypothetical protein ACOYBP_04410 [Microbacteriaceae bacterium]